MMRSGLALSVSPVVLGLALLGLGASPVLSQAVPRPMPVEAEPGMQRMPEVWEAGEGEPGAVDRQGRSAYGLFLVGRLATGEGDTAVGADYLRRAQELVPDEPALQLQAFTSAIIAGDLDYAARLSPTGADVPPVIAEAGRLVEAVQLYGHGDARAAHALLSSPIRRPHARAGGYVAPFIAAAAGDWDTALAPVPSTAFALNGQYGRYHRALLLEMRGRHEEADTEYQTILAGRTGVALFILPYGEFLERRGRRVEAVALYDSALAEGERADVRAARTRAESRGRPPALLSLRQGAAMALGHAARQAGQEGAHEFAAVYLRLAHELVPDPATLLAVGVHLAEADLETAARAMFGRIGPDQPDLYVEARIQSALSLQDESRDEEALAELERAFAVRPGNAYVALLLAAQLAGLERYDEALVLLNGPLLNTGDQGHTVHLLRGSIHDSLGNFERAEAELWAAHVQRPDDAIILNHLGYIWVDSGQRIEQGTEMIERAAAADPGNANIQDSLGWARYRQGRYAEAVTLLEGAVDALPANAVINNHLGDAYWRVGRTREARFQWTRVLTLEPDAALRVEAEHKLEAGLPEVDDMGRGASGRVVATGEGSS